MLFLFLFFNFTDLNLSHNKIASLPTELNQLNELSSADFSHNKLLEFPDGMYGLTNLKKLNLSNNKIAGECKNMTWGMVWGRGKVIEKDPKVDYKSLCVEPKGF